MGGKLETVKFFDEQRERERAYENARVFFRVARSLAPRVSKRGESVVIRKERLSGEDCALNAIERYCE